MPSAIFMQSEFCRADDKCFEGCDLDLSLWNSVHHVSMLKHDRPTCFEYDEMPSHKRAKQEPSGAESVPCGSSSSTLNCLPKLNFRDYVWAYTERFLAIEAMEEAATVLMVSERNEEKDTEGSDGMKLVQQLMSCAEAVACRDKTHASVLLSELRGKALVFGTSFQRVASCFVQGLSDRLVLVQPLRTVGVFGPPSRTLSFTAEKDEALRLVYEICPYIKFGHFVANASILEAFEGESSVHVVDLGMTLSLPHGQQWRSLIKSLANRVGKPTHRLHITGVGSSAERLQAIGGDLDTYARSLGLDFEFSYVESSLENLKTVDFKLNDGEAVVINSILQLHCVVKESRGALNSVLHTLHELSPKLLILVEQDASHNGPFFLGRFMEALHYYSAIFDSLDAMLPKYDTRRAKIEQFFYADEIKNIVSCEGQARVERHERVDQWRRRMSRAGFQAAPVKMMVQAKQWMVKANVCEGYTVSEEKGCLILGWKSKAIIAASCWKSN
ncbi:GRAS family transcription factor family protein [Euphorbia peplus]|nr:GRAS family transcription factor family protein [Euphorbia peplus]